MEHEPENERPMLHSTRLPPAPEAEPRPSDDHGTRAQELRDALEELRADLDGRVGSTSAPAPVAATTPSSPRSASSSPSTGSDEGDARAGARSGRRLALGALAAVVLLAGVFGVVRVVAWSVAGAREIRQSSGSGSGSVESASPSSPSAPPASSPGTVAASPTPSSSPLQPDRPPLVPPPGLPGSGPGADAPGAELTAMLGQGDSVVVYERLVVRPGTTSVHLAPAPAQALPRELQGVGFTVTGLRVSVDGRAVTAPRDALGGWRVTRPDGGPITQLVLGYRLAGAIVRASPQPPGRATLVLRPITGPEASGARDPVVVRLRDRRIGQVYCPSGSQPLCDTVRGTAHVATVPAGSPPIVLAQVTLP